MKQKIALILSAVMLSAALAACGSNGDSVQTATAAPEQPEAAASTAPAESSSADIAALDDSDIQAALADYYGIYVCQNDPNQIVVDESGISYGVSLLSIESIGGGYVILNDSDAIIILNDGSISANLSHTGDDSYLDTYEKTSGPSEAPETTVPSDATVDADTGSDSAQTVFALSEYVGTYQSDGSDDSFTLTEDQIKDISIIADIYNNEDVSGNEMSTVLSQDDILQDADGNSYIEFYTQYGCDGKAVFLSGGKIQLTLTLGDESYEGTFTKQ